jgi:hypothetical protein
MIDLHAEVEKGIVSERALSELKDKFALIRSNIHKTWEGTTALQTDEREILYHKLHALNELERSFSRDIDSAKMAKKQLEAENVDRSRNS